MWVLSIMDRYVMGVRTLVPAVPGDALCWVARNEVSVANLLANDF